MALEKYRFRYQGAEFEVKIDMDDDCPTTEEPPNLHVMAGSWKTWHLDPGTYDGPRPHLYQSVEPGNPSAQHPAGNLSFADSNSDGGILCINPDTGYLYVRPFGSTAVWRMHK